MDVGDDPIYAPRGALGGAPMVTEVKRRFYFAYLIVSAVGTVVVWATSSGSGGAVADLLLPPIVGLVAVFALLLWRSARFVPWVERSLFGVSLLATLVSLFMNLATATSSAERVTALQTHTFWLPVVIVWGFIALGSRLGVIAAGASIGATGAVFVAAAVVGVGLPSLDLVLHGLAAVSAFVVLLVALVRMLEGQVAARSSAEARAAFALRDPLTNLPNRRAFQARFEHARAFVDGSGESLAVFFVDVDDFKGVNDAHGHAVGDDVLRQFGARLVATVRGGDFVARVGGDEFVVLAIVAVEADARALAAKLVAAYAAPFVLDGSEVALSASIGLSVYPHDGRDGDALLSRADAAMYQVKADGKNGWVAASRTAASTKCASPS